MSVGLSLLSLISLILIPLLVTTLCGEETRRVTGSMVSYPSGTEQISGFLAEPEGTGPFPAIIMIHEFWGLNDQIKDQAKRFAQEGYLTLAVDLYRGKIAKDTEEARNLSQSLPKERALGDLLSAIAFLKSYPKVEPKKIGVIGWCMGGGFSFELSLRSGDMAATVIYYGRVSSDPDQLKKISSPVLGIFGLADPVVPPQMVKDFEKAMKETKKEAEIYSYEGAGHAFANPTRSDAYRKEAAEDAWKKTISFLKRHLG